MESLRKMEAKEKTVSWWAAAHDVCSFMCRPARERSKSQIGAPGRMVHVNHAQKANHYDPNDEACTTPSSSFEIERATYARSE
jgi:hypothetical protein